MGGVFLVLLYGLGAIGVVVIGGLFYLRAVGSRRRYCCPQCGERFGVELMDASRCNVCGAPLRRPMKGV